MLDVYFAQNRFYDPSIKRFTQVDPVKDGTNFYAYCGNNPIINVDVWGLYYIKAIYNEKYTAHACMSMSCNHSDGKNVGYVRTGIKNYEFLKQSTLGTVFKNALSVYPATSIFSGLIVLAGETLNDYVGGTSATKLTYRNALESGGSATVEALAGNKKIKENVSKILKKGSAAYTVVSTTINVLKDVNRVYLDKIADEIMTYVGVKKIDTNLQKLNKRLSAVYDFMSENAQYFFATGFQLTTITETQGRYNYTMDSATFYEMDRDMIVNPYIYQQKFSCILSNGHYLNYNKNALKELDDKVKIVMGPFITVANERRSEMYKLLHNKVSQYA